MATAWGRDRPPLSSRLLTDMDMISAGGVAEADGYIGYIKPYATSHQDFDDDKAFQEQARNVARALGAAIDLARTGQLENPGKGLRDPQPK